MSGITSTFGERIASTARRASAHPTNATTAMSALTKSYTGAAGVKVSMWPGWWDPSAALTTDAGGNGAAVRTNQTGTRLTVEVTGTTVFGVVFSASPYSSYNALGERWTPRPSYFRYRITTDGVAGSWVYGNRPIVSDAGWIISSSLTSTSTYRFELEPSHFSDAINESISGGLLPFEYMREIEAFASGEHGAWNQISGFVTTSGATFNDLTFSQTALNVLILGDSNCVGQVPTASGTTNIELAVAGTTDDTDSFDQLGHSIQWARQIIETYAAAQNKRPVIHNLSYGGLWLARMSAAVRAAYITVSPGIASSVYQRFGRRTGYTTGSYPTYTATGRANPSWTPDVIIIALTSNDQVIAHALISAVGSPAEFGGTTFRDDAVTTINEMHAGYASAKVFLVNNHLTAGAWSTSPDSHAQLNTAAGAGYLNLSATSWGRYVDLSTYGVMSATDIAGLHPTGAQHTSFASAIQSAFNALMAL